MAQDNCAVTAPPTALGDVYGRLIVMGGPYRMQGKKYWHCQCDCGCSSHVRQDHLRSGATISCGCAHVKHGHTLNGKHSIEYIAWTNMHQRCANPRNPKYKDYGERGITVCDRWNDFDAFLNDMGPRPDNLSLERIDNDKGYAPDNCKWATKKEQQNNRRVCKRRAA